VSELSDSDTVHDDDDDDDVYVTTTTSTAAAADDAKDDPGSGVGQDQGQLEVKDDVQRPGPWFVRPPSNAAVAVGRTLRCECVVSGQQPIGQSTAWSLNR